MVQSYKRLNTCNSNHLVKQSSIQRGKSSFQLRENTLFKKCIDNIIVESNPFFIDISSQAIYNKCKIKINNPYDQLIFIFVKKQKRRVQTLFQSYFLSPSINAKGPQDFMYVKGSPRL